MDTIKESPVKSGEIPERIMVHHESPKRHMITMESREAESGPIQRVPFSGFTTHPTHSSIWCSTSACICPYVGWVACQRILPLCRRNSSWRHWCSWHDTQWCGLLLECQAMVGAIAIEPLRPQILFWPFTKVWGTWNGKKELKLTELCKKRQIAALSQPCIGKG